ncbi:MAG: 16S rRNA (uracil(1498)-N(3))-methyltransferase [Spirochaetes bacterium]|nr:16S rRNA (uracil(1498)-N(3))-methyltransferase [Spirochaetota bacterium]
MPQFFVRASEITGGRCVIGGEDFRHLATVRRVRVHDRITLRSDGGLLITARIIRIGTEELEAELLEETPGHEPGLRIDLCLALLKGGNFDQAVRQATEVGVHRIIPVKTERSVPVPRGDGKARGARWERIAAEAAKQSMRAGIPSIGEVLGFQVVVDGDFPGVRIIAHPAAAMDCRDFASGGAAEAAILVGPEGGFSPAEIERASASGWLPLRFGVTCLRAETAAVVVPALALCLWGGGPDCAGESRVEGIRRR